MSACNTPHRERLGPSIPFGRLHETQKLAHGGFPKDAQHQTLADCGEEAEARVRGHGTHGGRVGQGNRRRVHPRGLTVPRCQKKAARLTPAYRFPRKRKRWRDPLGAIGKSELQKVECSYATNPLGLGATLTPYGPHSTIVDTEYHGSKSWLSSSCTVGLVSYSAATDTCAGGDVGAGQLAAASRAASSSSRMRRTSSGTSSAGGAVGS